MTRRSAREIVLGSLVSSTGMALISKPVKGQYTMMITFRISGRGATRSGTRFPRWMKGMRATAMITIGTIFAAVRIFSVFPESAIPMRFTPRKAMMTKISAARTWGMEKKLKYWPRPAAIVARPKTEDTR